MKPSNTGVRIVLGAGWQNKVVGLPKGVARLQSDIAYYDVKQSVYWFDLGSRVQTVWRRTPSTLSNLS